MRACCSWGRFAVLVAGKLWCDVVWCGVVSVPLRLYGCVHGVELGRQVGLVVYVLLWFCGYFVASELLFVDAPVVRGEDPWCRVRALVAMVHMVVWVRTQVAGAWLKAW